MATSGHLYGGSSGGGSGSFRAGFGAVDPDGFSRNIRTIRRGDPVFLGSASRSISRRSTSSASRRRTARGDLEMIRPSSSFVA
ncbi:MAG: hypothetical protein WKF75_05610 [Singulisphaera sp.]